MKKAEAEIKKLIRLIETDAEVITDPDDYSYQMAIIDGLTDALWIVKGRTAEEIY